MTERNGKVKLLRARKNDQTDGNTARLERMEGRQNFTSTLLGSCLGLKIKLTLDYWGEKYTNLIPVLCVTEVLIRECKPKEVPKTYMFWY
jgi:hypothetical protein